MELPGPLKPRDKREHGKLYNAIICRIDALNGSMVLRYLRHIDAVLAMHAMSVKSQMVRN
jgi:hypothetical protein